MKIAIWNTFTIVNNKVYDSTGIRSLEHLPPPTRKKAQSERNYLIQTEKLQSLTTNEWRRLLANSFR
jgi:hypothetical protein